MKIKTQTQDLVESKWQVINPKEVSKEEQQAKEDHKQLKQEENLQEEHFPLPRPLRDTTIS
jgi:hypothetical protein